MVVRVRGHRRAAQSFNGVGHCALSILLALTLSGPAFSRDDGEPPDRDAIEARRAFYEVLKSPSEEYGKCLYRDHASLLCPGTEVIAFEKHYRTKDYDLIVISMGALGSGTRWWDWKLIVEDGNRAIIKPLAN